MEIKLYKSDRVAIIDDDCYEKIKGQRWHLTNSCGGYAQTDIEGKSVFMHNMLLHTRDGFQVDHINGDGLDNRMTNLRECTPSQNMCNRGLQKNNTTGYKGVSHPINGRWTARIYKDWKQIRLGMFDTAKEAALAYNRAAIKYHGEFANLNEITED